GSGQHLAPVLQENRENANIDAGLGSSGESQLIPFNLWLAMPERVNAMATTIKPPVQIRLEASSFCNLRCPVCPTTRGVIHHQAVGGGFLRFEDFRKLLDDNPGLKRIELSNWGEIFLNPALLSVLELAHERGVELAAYNGVNLNKIRPEVLEGLVRYQ